MRDGPVGPDTMTSQQPNNLSIEQLREMAARQQQQIEAQQSHLVAKVRNLPYWTLRLHLIMSASYLFTDIILQIEA